jgi:hypothetical protein
MTTHITSLTYRPKIEAVKEGRVRQTIRRFNINKPKLEGDNLILHTWSGKPYRTPWGYRLNTPIKTVLHLLYSDGDWMAPCWNNINEFLGHEYVSDEYIDKIAYLDGIEPPTREGLEKTLLELNGLKTLEGTQWEVIRW